MLDNHANWQTGVVGDVFELTGGYSFKSSDFARAGVPVIKIKNVKAGQLDFSKLEYVPDSFLATRPDQVARNTDLLITMSGNRFDGSRHTWVGKVAYFGLEQPFLVNQRVGILRPLRSDAVCPRFFAYLLAADPYQDEFIAIATSSGGQANLSASQIKRAPLLLPPLSTQEAIAHILGTIDDKIELNRKMNETLEQMARALFKSWFVDFDPVHAKARGEKPFGMDDATAALFPDSFEDSELGPIPKEWSTTSIGEVLELAYGKSLPKGKRRPGSVPVYGSGGISGFHETSLVSGPGIIVGRKGTVGSVRWSNVAFFPIDTVFYAVVRNNSLPMEWAYETLRRIDILGLAADSAVPGVNRNSVYAQEVVVPSGQVLQTYAEHAKTWMSARVGNEHQIESLEAIRDTMLPKLLSGDLEISDAARIVGVAV